MAIPAFEDFAVEFGIPLNTVAYLVYVSSDIVQNWDAITEMFLNPQLCGDLVPWCHASCMGTNL